MTVEPLLRSGDTIIVDTDDRERTDEQINRSSKLPITDVDGNDTVVYGPHVQAAQLVSDD